MYGRGRVGGTCPKLREAGRTRHVDQAVGDPVPAVLLPPSRPHDGFSREWRGGRIPSLCRVSAVGTRRSLGFAECHGFRTRQRLTTIRYTDGRRTAGARAGHVHGLCRVRAQWHSAKIKYAECPRFADSRHSAKFGHAVCHVFAECCGVGTQQRGVGTRQMCGFR